MPIKISILHPSFQRSSMALETYKKWASCTDVPMDIEYIISIDNGDSTIEEYEKNFNESERKKFGKFIFSVGPSTNAVQALNRAATLMSQSSEIFIAMADDIDCFQSWDTAIISVFKNINNFTTPAVAKVFDGLWKISVPRITVAIGNKAFYNRIGYIVYSEYISMFGDDDFYQVCLKLNCIIDATHLKFQHNHYTLGLNPIDDTYKKGSNGDTWAIGERVFKERMDRNFDL